MFFVSGLDRFLRWFRSSCVFRWEVSRSGRTDVTGLGRAGWGGTGGECWHRWDGGEDSGNVGGLQAVDQGGSAFIRFEGTPD